MKTQPLGSTELDLTPIGLGTWAIGGGNWAYGWGDQDEADSISAIHEALDSGINWIDTAPAYGLGRSEEVVGKAIAQRSDRPLIATKFGLRWNDRGDVRPRLKKDSILAEVDDSLRRLGVETIDLIQVHWPRPDGDIEEAWRAVQIVLRKGKARYAGVCNFDAPQIERIDEIHPVGSLQTPYSMLERGAERTTLPYCAAHDIGVVVYSPMQRGLLTGAFSKSRLASLPQNDHRRKNRHFQEPAFSATMKLVDGLRLVAREGGWSVAGLAVAWVLSHPAVTSAIVGARRPGQIDAPLRAADHPLSTEEKARIDGLIAEREQALSDAGDPDPS